MATTDTHNSDDGCRFVVGIDLGTTNSAVTYVDTHATSRRVRTLPIPQLVAPGEVAAREGLPSFRYEPAKAEFSPGSLRLPWSRADEASFVGCLARDQGMLVPGRVIASAKSWLCHAGVDRTAGLLPWHGAADVTRLSPVEVSSRYLQHVANVWDFAHPEERLAAQDIVLTLPASFDEVARELTVKAAADAGLKRVVLIEEPQAAFYAWIDAHADNWQQHVEPGQKILVCDVGGGTSDFTLIRVREGEAGRVRFHRVAVGEHLILGGDNLDLALAHHLEARLTGARDDDGRLDPRRWGVLVRSCRQVKETLLGDDAPESVTVSLPGTGSKLIGGGQQIPVSRDEVREVLLDGFFPVVELEAKPAGRRSGFQEFGLPYAPDPAITRYLAAFLTVHRNVALDGVDESAHDPARPDIVLLNGGLFASPVIRSRLLEVLLHWFGREEPNWRPLVLENERLDLAVARGAAYYGMVCRGEGVRIAAGLARTYYVGVEGEEPTAVCLLPAGTEPGQELAIAERRFQLRVAEPIEFPLYVSSTRLTDAAGELAPVDREQMTALPPVRTVLKTSRAATADVVDVNLQARLTEIGTLDIWCREVDGRRSWKLAFDVRSASQTDVAPHEAVGEQRGIVDEGLLAECRVVIENAFASGGSGRPANVMKKLGTILGASRNEWPPSLLRELWHVLIEHEDEGRRQSAEHEARWLNLAGFALRPGYGMALDDWRVAETWRLLQGKLRHAVPACRSEWWILWRRIAGGLTAGQQQSFAAPLLSQVRQSHRQFKTGKGRSGQLSTGTHEAAEMWRLLGSLELLPLRTKLELGNQLIDLLPRPKLAPVREAALWTLARVGARVPVYGPLNGVVAPDMAERWLAALIEMPLDVSPLTILAVMQLARRTGDRYRDLSPACRRQAVEFLQSADAPQHTITLVAEGGALESDEQSQVFGESLPKGLRIA